jgi:isopenicillin N synthase-like dioxygenase
VAPPPPQALTPPEAVAYGDLVSATVPEVDVGPLLAIDLDDLEAPVPPAVLAEAAPAARAIDAACREVGFFTIAGHGVGPSALAELDREARAFFALGDDRKALIEMARAGSAWRGWFPLGGELTSGVPDRKEGIYFGSERGPDDPRVRAGLPLHGANLFPTHPAGLRAAVLDHLDAMGRVGQAVLAGMAIGLGLEPRWFVRHLTADPVVLFRIFRYPPTEPVDRGAGDDDLEAWGVGEHTDYGLLTVLGHDGTPGLEVRTRDAWVPVDTSADRFVCNLGDMLERLTGGRYRSTPHRVRNTSGAERLSFPFFLDPSWDAEVDRLPIVERPVDDGAAERWDHASVHGFTGTYGDYLLGKVARVFPELAAGAALDTGGGPPGPAA